MADTPRGVCRFNECGRDIWHEELGICYTCYSGLRYWRDRSIADVRARVSQLTKLQDRMETFMVGDIPKRSLPKIQHRENGKAKPKKKGGKK